MVINLKHEINIKANLRTDLAIDDTTEEISGRKIKVTSIKIDKKNSKLIHKKCGNYLTIEFKDVTDIDNREKLTLVLTKELKKLLKKLNLINKRCLIIGLGNSNSTPDSLGPRVVKKIITTAYLKDIGPGFSDVAAYSVGVKGETGFESKDIVKALVKIYKPDFIFVVDSLASKSLKRLNKTIQITDTGINPGSGVANNRLEISEKVLGVKTIAIGVPTVVDLKNLVNNIEENMMVTSRDIDFIVENIANIIAISINKALHKKYDSK